LNRVTGKPFDIRTEFAPLVQAGDAEFPWTTADSGKKRDQFALGTAQGKLPADNENFPTHDT
jgi:hypothetical protein